MAYIKSSNQSSQYDLNPVKKDTIKDTKEEKSAFEKNLEIVEIDGLIKRGNISNVDKGLLREKLENLKSEYAYLNNVRIKYRKFIPNRFIPKLTLPYNLTSLQEEKIVSLIEENKVHNTKFSRFVRTEHKDLSHLQLDFKLPDVPTESIRETPQSSNKPSSLRGVSRIESGIPNFQNLRLDFKDELGVYDDELISYINNRYDFLIKYCRFIRDFIKILKPPPDSKSIPSTSFQTEEDEISKHKDEYSKIQEEHVMYSVVVSNVRLQQNHLVKLQELFTKLFTKPKQFSNEVDYRVFQTYFTDEYFENLRSMVTSYNDDVAKKHLIFYKQISKEDKTYKDLVKSIRDDIDTFKSFVNNFIGICNIFVNYMVDGIDTIDIKKIELQKVIERFRKLKEDQYLIDEILKDNINEKLKKSGGRRKPTTKKSKKSNHADMNMKDIRRLCKANQIKLSTTKDGVRIIYKKKELITKLKRKKIL